MCERSGRETSARVVTASASERRRRKAREARRSREAGFVGVINTGAPGESIERTYQRIMANLEKA